MKRKISRLILLSALLIGCKKDDDTALDPNAIASDEVRVTATITAPGVQPTDQFSLVGGFANPNFFNPKGSMGMRKNEDGTYSIDVKMGDLIESYPQINYLVYRNQENEEVDANCTPMLGRPLDVAGNLGKEIKITVVAFKGTGSCPP